jgi:hypothetical protein
MAGVKREKQEEGMAPLLPSHASDETVCVMEWENLRSSAFKTQTDTSKLEVCTYCPWRMQVPGRMRWRHIR